MRIGIFENIMTPGGHEVDFDRIIVSGCLSGKMFAGKVWCMSMRLPICRLFA